MSYRMLGYKYVDDLGNVWAIRVSDFLAEVAGLERIVRGENIRMLPGRMVPRHIKLVALTDRPGMAKYRADLITNERDPSKVLGKKFVLHHYEMECFRYVGEQRRG